MISDVIDIASERPIELIWKHLRFFLDVASVSERIFELHKNSSPPPRRADIKKQATQLGYCIRQAEEYFRASAQVGLPTRPVLLYYGAICLTKALVLLKKDGNHSFDALRKSGRHKHHGLNMEGGVIKSAGREKAERLFSSIRWSCNTHRDAPWGHFPLFYDSLVPPVFRLQCKTTVHTPDAIPLQLHEFWPQHCTTLHPLANLVRRTFNALEVLKTIPDLNDTLAHCGIQPGLVQGSVHCQANGSYGQDSDKLQKHRLIFNYFIDNVSQEQQEHFIALITGLNPAIRLTSRAGGFLAFTRHVCPSSPDPNDNNINPDILSDVSGRLYYLIDPQTVVPEPASLFMLLFCLGMLSRYHSDIWMDWISTQVEVAEIIDTLLNTCYRKFPNLILDQLTHKHHSVRLT